VKSLVGKQEEIDVRGYAGSCGEWSQCAWHRPQCACLLATWLSDQSGLGSLGALKTGCDMKALLITARYTARASGGETWR